MLRVSSVDGTIFDLLGGGINPALQAERLAERVVDPALPARPGCTEGGENVRVEAQGGGDLCHIGL